MKAANRILSIAFLALATAHSARAENSIVVESRSFLPAQAACTLGIWFENDVHVTGIVFPIEARSVSGGAFYLGMSTSPFILNPGMRVDHSPLGSGIPGVTPAASITRRRFENPAAQDCGGPISNSYTTSVGTLSGTSPDGFLFASSASGDGNFGEDIDLAPGVDPPVRDSASWLFTFDARVLAGCFVIDTCCVLPSGHLVAVDLNTQPVPIAFTAGTICIECDTAANLPPVLSCHNDTTIYVQSGSGGSVVAFAVMAGDDCSDPVVVCDPPSGSFFAVGTTSVTCVATDDQGLKDTCIFNVTVDDSGPMANLITVESRTFFAGQANCTVGVFIENVSPLRALILELEARSTTGGFYLGPVGSTFFTAQPGRRAHTSPLGAADPGGAWPAANITNRRFAQPNVVNLCSSLPSHSWSTAAATVDGISPDAVEYATSSSGDPSQGDLYTLPPGTDPPTRDSASFLFRFDAGLVTGCFEIDTCCVTPANHTLFVDANWQPVPVEFTKGTICIVCDPDANHPPQLNCPDVVRVTVLESEMGANVDFNSTALDDCSVPSISCNPASGSFFPVGTTAVTCIATDDQGAADTCTFDVIVKQGYPATENSITVESKTFVPGQTDCQVGVYLSNVDAITGLVMILEARTINGAFYTTSATNFFREQVGRRLDDSPLGTADAGGGWPAASVTRRKFDTVVTGGFCKWNVATANVGGTSPDAVMHATVSTGDPNIGESVVLAPGADPPFTADASWLFTFNAGMIEGCFEIDTTCVQPSGHLSFVDEFATPVDPLFTKGLICISSCICECHGNPANCGDPSVDVLDVVYVTNVAFRGTSSISDNNPLCPVHATDLNCDGVSDIIDAVKIIDVAFRGASPAAALCDPCP